RMNRSIDARSDLYACGVVLYEVLTGGLPFTASEPMEWIHCHVARQPVPPSDRVNGVPAAVSAIIMKLLAKNTEDRYQTAAGLEADLQSCLDEYDATGAISAFTLGASDVADRLTIPERLYGREEQVATLTAALNRVVHDAQPETVFVSGYSGIGKSSIVHELQKSVVHVGGIFASAKAEPFSRSVPYLTLAHALKAPVRSLLARRQDELDTWKRAFQEALGSSGQLIVNVLPDLALVVGEQPPVPDLPPLEASNRFRAVFRRFIQVFAQPGRPLVLFLDDLQWLDESTIELLESLATSAETHDLLLVGAYRDNELDVTHPLVRGIDRLRRSGARYAEVVLSPLVLNDLVAVIADTLRADPAQVLTLARLVHTKTGGNPFFAIQFLTTLAQEGLLRFDRTARAWTWDVAGIEAQGYTDNVVDLMVSKLGRLSVPTRTALTGLACLGHAGEISTLSLIQGQPIDDLHAALREAVRAGLVVRTGSSYEFSHDRLQEAAYSLIDENARAETHLRIGRLLRKTMSPADLEQLFDVVSHLNRGSDLLTTDAERVDTATLNLEAGRAAMAATAHASALKYLVAAEDLLGVDTTSGLAALRFEVSLRRAHCEVLTGAFDAATDRLSSLADNAATLSDQAAVTGIRLVLHMATGRPDLAVQACLRYLRSAGIVWSAHPAEADVRTETQRIAELLAGRSIESLLQLPIAIDPDLHATMDVLCAMVPAAILTDENLLGLVVARMTTLSIERGNTDGASYAYVLLNMVVGLRFGDYRTGARFGHLSVDLVAHRGMNRFTARVYLCFGSTIVPWTQALVAGREWITRARDAAMTSGDLLHYAYSGNCLVTNLLATGQPLAEIHVHVQQALAVARQLRFGIGDALIGGQRMLLQALRGLGAADVAPGGDAFDPQQFEARLEDEPHLGLPACWYWIRKLQSAFYAADFDTAIAAAAKAEPLLWTSP
ncbi:MAG TPA: AAA family ATPase, partial [Vicinamibacterales bacterium]|nr:AAA family ATPase [Vicinamibacterales bacterium]